MNVQTETLDNHIARLTVEIETNQLEKAKKKAAKKLAKYVRIPGFRKGKAPYRILVNYVGEGAILEEAIEDLGNTIYGKALDESEVKPYTSGQLEDFKLEPAPTFVFTVPLQPTVELGDYQSVRVDYEQPTVEDKDVDDALRRLQEEHAVVEESASAAKKGDRVQGDIHGFFAEEDEDGDEEEAADVDEVDDADDEHDEDDHDDSHDAPIHQNDATFYLDEEREPVPGFADALVGVEAGEKREFELAYPDDEDKYGEFSGKTVRFVMEVDSVENVTLPELNDGFAERVTEDEDETLTLLQLRARLRENIEKSVEDNYKSEYVDLVMGEMVERATFAYPQAMIQTQIDSMLESSASRFGVSLEDYLRLTQMEREDLYQDETYVKSAENYIKRSLIMRGILDEEDIEVSDDHIEAEISRVLSQFGEQAEQYRSLFDTPEMRDNVTNTLTEQRIIDRIVMIGKGEEPPASTTDTPAQDDSDTTSTEADNENTEETPVISPEEATETDEK